MGNKLTNKVFVSTRPTGQNKELSRLIENENGKLIELPTIEIVSANLTYEDEELLQHINQFSWIVFSSYNCIRFFFDKLYEVNGSYYLPSSIKIATIGNKTSKILIEYGHETTLENAGSTGEDLAQELLKAVNSDDYILFPEGNLARGTIAEIVSKKAECAKLVVYSNELPKNIDTKIANQIINDRYSSIILTSPSCFNNLLKILDNKSNEKNLRLICIGATTASEVRSKGITPLATAKIATVDGIFDTILETFSIR